LNVHQQYFNQAYLTTYEAKLALGCVSTQAVRELATRDDVLIAVGTSYIVPRWWVEAKKEQYAARVDEVAAQ
jgi:hypothetical protein